MLGFDAIGASTTDGVPRNWLYEGHEAAALSRIRQPATTLALWHRSGLEPLGRWLDALPGERLPSGRARLRARDVPQAMADFGSDCGTPQTPDWDRMVRDVVVLAGLFSDIAGTSEIELRVDPLDHDGCRLFHVDRVDYRLLCTYCGPGTEWVPPADAPSALRAQTDYRGPLERLPRFAVGLFKGANLTASPIVHRSPPIAGRSLHRLLVCLTAPAA